MQIFNVDRELTQPVTLSTKFIWIFFLMLSNNKKDINRFFMLKYISGVNLLFSFFKAFDFNFARASFKNWNKQIMLNSVISFFSFLRNSLFSNKFLKYFYYAFKKYFTLLSIFFIPNFFFKKIDIVLVNRSTCRYGIKKILISDSFFFSYGKKNSKFFFFNFFFFRHYLNSYCLAKYTFFLNSYFFFFNNLFYGNYRLFFIFKNQIAFATQWWETRKKFVVSVSSVSKVYDNSYNQKATFFFWSSVSFLKYLRLSKRLRLSLNVKFIMIRHLRRMLILFNVDKLLFLFKTFVSGLNVLYFTVNMPINEVFLNPSDGEPVLDVLVKLNSNTSFDQFMDKYKNYVQELLCIDVLSNFLKKWELLLLNFKGCLKCVNAYKSGNLGDKIFLRYSFDCDLLFFFRKKFLALKQKKAQSISKRRVKRIVKLAKRRFWIF